MCVTFLLSSPFDIQRFSLVRTCGKNQNRIITPWSGEFMKALKQHRVSTGSFYLRRKYAESDYALYKGRLLKEGYEKLTAFKLEEISLEQRITLKFFKEKKAAWQHEIKDVYFDNRLVYVEGNIPELFFVQHRSWIKEKALDPRPAVLSMTTSPSEALVFFNGESCGESPALLGEISGMSALVEVRKKDYYTVNHFVDIKQNRYNTIDIKLVKKLRAERLENLSLNKYDKFDSPNPKDADTAIAQLDRLLGQQVNQLEIRFETRYPILPPKGSQESEEHFRSRKLEYLKTREKEKDALLRFHADWINRVKTIRQKLVQLKVSPKTHMARGDTPPINKTPKDSVSGPGLPEAPKIVRTEQAEKARLARLAAELALEMKAVPAGCFIMGNEEGGTNELPLHRVCIEGFQMDIYEVTQQDFIKVMGNNPSQFDDCPACPVEQVSWFQANEFCHKIGKRLPTEAEWEYACRAGGLNNYYWNKGASGSYAWYKGNAKEKTHNVGGKKANDWGLFDMSGNVWEWCADWHSKTYYADSPPSNPSGPERGAFKVVRGGGWTSQKAQIRSSFRHSIKPSDKNSDVGFRCVQ